ncbi:DNA-processing protein DprA [Streptomyces viridifaciens]|uniref:DNA-processing protein DprA n=1 Tax=Kitasatospora aureofaciens TaxID=1894 RepID=UPI0009A12A79|nr:DNA-processing protein DprA [Kitasatospora aureofaciens]QEU99739.1 DNA-protecting protein DprA [Streptomyces viridifaciens]UKZ05871.1 DNA-processing protein DprA [Streptomyces viridifaciens]HJD85431.1 DNA-processing protein DprA [Kitasatospora aureofaciens]
MNQLLGHTAQTPQAPQTPQASRASQAPRAAAAGPPSAPQESERLARVLLNRLSEPGDAVVGRWLRELPAVEVVRAIRDGDVPDHPGLDSARLAAYQARLPGLAPADDLKRVRDAGGRFIIPGDTEWPSQLDDLGDGRPIGLWTTGTGSLRLLALRSVALVGSRACTAYGAHVAGELSAQLAERGWVVVSGAAYGIDAAAHRGALAVGGMTVAVLACGVDVAYPKGNAELIRRIGVQGLLVSELPPGEHPNRFRFVLRNRVIAALTRGTVVVEAALRSGALSTARRARDLNRHTMGVAGPVTSELSAGVHALIRSGGATLVTDATEITDLVGAIGDDLAPQRSGPVLPRDLLEPAVARVLEAVPATAEGAPVERLARQSGLPPDEVLQRLYELVSLGFVERHGAHWRVVRRRR